MARLGSGSGAQLRRRYERMRARFVRKARQSIGKRKITLLMLCERWGDQESRRAAEAFVRSIKSSRPMPLRWRLEQILAALTSGASDIDASARTLAEGLRHLVSEQEDLNAMARLLRKPTP